MLGLYIAKMAILTPLAYYTAITSLATVESVFLPLGTGLHPENFEKNGVVTSMSVFWGTWDWSAALDDHSPAGPLLGCQLPTLDPNYRSKVGFKSFNVYTPQSDTTHHTATTLVQH